jgi:hypothetical protein
VTGTIALFGFTFRELNRLAVIKQEALLRQWTVVLALPLATPLLFLSRAPSEPAVFTCAEEVR